MYLELEIESQTLMYILKVLRIRITDIINVYIKKARALKWILWNSILHNMRERKFTRNMNRWLSIGYTVVKPVDITRGKSRVSKLTKE
jgi:hypothetical protein